MVANILVGAVFAVIIIFAVRRVRRDAKNNSCSCGSGSCSSKDKCDK